MAAVHRTYARALLDAAREAGRIGEVRGELGDFAEATAQVPELAALLESPEVDRSAKAAALGELLGGADELTRNFLLLLVEKGRAGELADVHREFERLVAREERRLEVELTTAVELTDEEAREVVAEIERAAGQRLETTRKVDPDLIGGLVLQIGSLRVDASVRGRLQQLRRELRTRS